MKNYSLLIWDFNGTLLDDVGAALASVNDMLERRGISSINIYTYREYIDTPIRHFYEHVLDLDKEDYNGVLSEFQAGYERHVKNCGLTPFVREALNTAFDMRIPQVILSSSEQTQLERLIKQYDISKYFNAVLGSDDLLAGSKVERAEFYIKQHGIDASNALVIGDLLHDFEVAQAVGAQCLLITSGHHDRKRLETSGARVEDSLKGFIYE